MTGKWTSDAGGDAQRHIPGSPAPRENPPAAHLRENPFHCKSDKALRIAIMRLGRNRGRPGFGNGRAVRVLFD